GIVWKTPLPSWSGGSPVVWGDKVFVTSPSKAASDESAATQTDSGKRRRREERDPGGSELLLICIAKQDGSVLWERELDTGNKLSRKQNDSSPSPVTDGTHVWAVTGTGSVTAFDMEGEQVWKLNLQEKYGTFGLMFGYASSPMLYEGKLIIQVLHGYTTDDPSYIVAFDASTGDVRWRVERPTDAQSESPDAYTTPTLLRHGGTTQFVISGGDYVTGHDPDTGEEIWRAAGLNPKKVKNYRIITSPTVADGMIYVPSRRKPVLALRAGGTGDVTTSHLVWKHDEWGGPDVPTPVCDGTHLYLADDRGSVLCLNAKTGDVIWGPERPTEGTVSASPLLADGKLYVTNESAVTTVFAAGPAFEVLAVNQVDGGENAYTLSSLAVSNAQLFLRTATSLYCIEKR
ncbi:MAG: PQQ-binding-like beta-propeller repeat protein, partial [bacterium]|nr:PQQ-binding-like beta-propeller repeat protein [bacterium]